MKKPNKALVDEVNELYNKVFQSEHNLVVLPNWEGGKQLTYTDNGIIITKEAYDELLEKIRKSKNYKEFVIPKIRPPKYEESISEYIAPEAIEELEPLPKQKEFFRAVKRKAYQDFGPDNDDDGFTSSSF